MLETVPEDWRLQSVTKRSPSISFILRLSRSISAELQGGRRRKRRICLWTSASANYIIEGTKDGLIADLEPEARRRQAPLDIINGPLMAGMSEVGRLFNNNELIVAEVLQSAEAMKAAVNHLEQFMEKSESSARGKIVLATVKGDVHDIGKNLVEIILAITATRSSTLASKCRPKN